MWSALFPRFIALVLLLAGSAPAVAAVECTSSTGGPLRVPIAVPDRILVDADLKVGATLASIPFNGRPPGAPSITCRRDGLAVRVNYSYHMTTGALVGDGITYTSGIPGIGLRIKYPGNRHFPMRGAIGGTFVPSSPGTFYLYLVKTGQITAGGTLSFAEVAEARTAPEHGDYPFVTYQLAGSVEVMPRKPTCTVASTHLQVPMKPVLQRSFTGVGSTSEAVPWALELNCGGGPDGSTVAVSGVLTDATAPTNRSATLTLSQSSTARGIGIQVLRNGRLVPYGPDSDASGAQSQWSAGNASNGAFRIPFTVRYVQTRSRVDAGTANGNATFTLSYR